MADTRRVTDAGDRLLAPYRDLTDADLRRDGALFVCEGVLAVRRVAELGVTLRSLLVTPKRLHTIDDLDAPILVVEQEVMDSVVGFPLHRGVVAVAERPVERAVVDVVAGARTVAVLEGINDHENLGALFRNGSALGVGAFVLDSTCADPLYRRSVRVSLGNVLAVPFARSSSWRSDLGTAGFELVALTPHVDADPIESLSGDGRVALLLGAEGAGLSSDSLADADRKVRIPLAPGVDSLNVATAAAIAFHHRFPSRGG
jgi:tRNA G18 (ribose-2'-O)-methylase SpoU